MGSLEKRLDAVEAELIEKILLEALVQREIQQMLRVLRASEDIEDSLYEKVEDILVGAGYTERGMNRWQTSRGV